jgi:hypothetical protein
MWRGPRGDGEIVTKAGTRDEGTEDQGPWNRGWLVVFGEEAVDERDEVFAGAWEDELFGARVPVELKGGGGCGDVHLARGSVRCDEEPVAGIDEDDGQRVFVLADFEGGTIVPGAVMFGALDEVPLERVKHGGGGDAEIMFVVHARKGAAES